MSYQPSSERVLRYAALAGMALWSFGVPMLHAQGLNNLWMGGYATFAAPPYGASDIDFHSGVPVISLQGSRSIDLYRTSSNISDSNGNLLFFTNGVVVGNQMGDTMQYGTGLSPSTYTDDWYPDGLPVPQGALIIPDPGTADQHYIFHCTVDDIMNDVSEFLYSSLINMSLDNGNGAVIQKNNIIYSGILQAGRLDAVRHGNGRDWWIYTHEANTDRFIRFLVTPSGIEGPYDQYLGVTRPPDAGRTAFSPNGNKFAYYWGESDLDIFTVDRCTGLLGDWMHIDIEDYNGAGGVAFSSNSRYLYVSSVLDVYQVDTEAPDVVSSLTLIAEWDSTYSPGPPFATLFNAAQLAPDGKIYISTGNATDKLHVINHPDSLGVACDLVQHGITLPTYWFNSLPNHPNYHLGALDGSPCDTLGLSVAEQKPTLNLSLFPNPNVGAFTLSFAPQPGTGMLEVHDVNGRLVHHEPIAPWSQLKRLQLPLASGVYQCRLRFGEVTAVQRFVVE